MGYKNPADAAMPYFNQIPGTITPYYQPYINAGNQALSTLMKQYQTLLSNPDAIMKLAGSGFQSSPGYQYQYNQGMNAANQAAASGGMLGTPYHQQDAANMASNLANQDYYNYLNHALGLYNTGLSGEQGINEMGFKASDSLASGLASNLSNEAGLAYQGQMNNNQHSSDMWHTILGGLSGLLTAPYGQDKSTLLGDMAGGISSLFSFL